jgi:regulator of sigma E protease
MIVNILVFFAILSLLVLVHELGHYFVAKKAGIWVEEFGFGLPPRVWGKKFGQTIFSLNLFPFGGFVKLHGEGSDEALAKPRRAFLNKGKVARTSVLLAGVIMNFLLGAVAFGIVYSFSGVPRETQNVRVVEIAPGSPAQEAGLLVGDVVRKVNEENITSSDELSSQIDALKGTSVTLEVENEVSGKIETKKLKVTPRETPPEGEGPLGVGFSTVEAYFPPVWQRPFLGVYYGFQDAVYWGKAIITGISSIFSDLSVGQAPKGLTGPFGIYALSSEICKIGILECINFLGIISVNLAILNILPFPALDGGRLVFILIETISGKKVVPRIEAAIHTVGMVILLIIIFAVTARDIRGLISAGSISGFLESVLR